MNKNSLLPAGFSDKIFPRSQKNSLIIEKIIEIFLNYGYLRVTPPLIEFEETLLSEGPGSKLKDNSFRVMDPISQKMMAVRSDMTTQISRISSYRMAHYSRPLRLSYSGEVLRVKPTGLKLERQTSQVGAEIIGDSSTSSETEIIIISLKILKALDLTNLSIDLNFQQLRIDLINKLKDNPNFNLIINAIEKKDLNYLNSLQFENKENILNLLKSSGKFIDENDFIKKLNLVNKNNKYVLNVVNVAKDIKNKFENVNIMIDPLEKNSFDYHHGLTFTIFGDAIQGGIVKGGTYCTIKNETATGMSLYVDLLDSVPNSFFLNKNKVLIEQNDFINADKLIKKGYQIIFYKNLNSLDFNLAKKLDCKLIFFDNKLIKVE